MSDVIGWLTAVAGLVVLFHFDPGKRDGRFKTGYKGNVVPTQMALKPRLGWTCGFWLVATACLAGRALLQPLLIVLAFGLGAAATWTLYPRFWSHFQRDATSAAAFFAARATMCLVIGGVGAYFADAALGPDEVQGRAVAEQSRDLTTPVLAAPVKALSPAALPPPRAAIRDDHADGASAFQAAPAAGGDRLRKDKSLGSDQGGRPGESPPPTEVRQAHAKTVDEGSPKPDRNPAPVAARPDGESPLAARPALATQEPIYTGARDRFSGVAVERGVVVTAGERSASLPREPSATGTQTWPRIGPQGEAP